MALNIGGYNPLQNSYSLSRQGEITDPQAKRDGHTGDGPGGKCETCANRKYQDGSDEMVSFKSPSHISPTQAPAAVMSHEQEHVQNAYSKASKGNGKVLQASVQIHTSICPECGRSYVSGGTTTTQIKYSNEGSPYANEFKSADRAKYLGANADYAV